MVTLNKEFDSQPSAIASYDYSDISDQTGKVVFYLFSAYNAAIDYYLGKDAVYSDEIELPQAGTDNSPTFTKDVDLDFDLSAFNGPNTIRGVGFVNITLYFNSAPTTNAGTQAYVVARVKKADVEIASGTSSILSLDTMPKTKTLCIPITIPITTFGVGEYLRLTIEVWAKSATTEGVYLSIAYDPKNRDGTLITPSTDSTITTIATFICPFNIDL